MTKLMVTLKAYVAGLVEEDGQGLAEYALIIVLVSIAVVAALQLMTTELNNVFSSIATALQGAGG
ncbi:MAG: Flp family type IVb pilin [Caldilineaceae bacterium]